MRQTDSFPTAGVTHAFHVDNTYVFCLQDELFVLPAIFSPFLLFFLLGTT